MGWDRILGHDDVTEMFRRSIAKGRLAHTYLLVGPAGIGKKQWALTVAQSLFCERFPEAQLQACGQCAGCKQVLARSHPDLLLVELPEGKTSLPIDLFLGADELRGKAGLCHDLTLKPLSGRRKIALIDDAHLLGDEAANALLKTLEEPPGHSLLFLIATSTDALLATIRSRCQVLRFAPLSDEQVGQLLLREQLAEKELDAREAAAMSQGSLVTAVEFLDPAVRERRGKLFDLLSSPRFASPAIMAEVTKFLDEAGSEAAQQRKAAGWVIRFSIEFFRRALRELSHPGLSEALPPSIAPQIQRFLKRFPQQTPETLELLGEVLERVMDAEVELDNKASVALCLETMFDDLGKLFRTPAAAGT